MGKSHIITVEDEPIERPSTSQDFLNSLSKRIEGLKSETPGLSIDKMLFLYRADRDASLKLDEIIETAFRKDNYQFKKYYTSDGDMVVSPENAK